MRYRDPSEKSFLEMLSPVMMAFRRYWKLAIGPALAVIAIGTIAGMRWPAYYAADTRIVIQPQRINSKLIEEPEKNEMRDRLEGLTQEILSRPRLRSVLEKFNVYPEYTGIVGAEQALKKLRQAIQITPAESQAGVQTFNTFQLSFIHADPEMTFKVTNALANLFIEESIVNQQSEVRGAEEFFDAQLEAARRQLEMTEKKRQEFVSANFGKLPEHLEQATTRLQTLSSQLDTNTRLIEANMIRRGNLETELGEIRRIAPAAAAPGAVDSLDPRDRLAHLEAALVVLKSRYSDEHPDVVKTKEQIKAMREEVAKGGGVRRDSAGAGANPQMSLSVRREIGETEVALTSLRDENNRLKEMIEKLESDISEMPKKEQELLAIDRDYATVKANYDRLRSAKDDATLQSSLIKSQKGTQFRIVDPAELPRIPAGPNRTLITGGAIAGGIALFFALPILLFFVNSSYRTKDGLEEDLGLAVLGVIPPMATPQAMNRSRRLNLASLAASALTATVAGLILVAVL